MAKIRGWRHRIDAQRQWIRLLLHEWGRWHAADQSLPPHARLRTPGDPIYQDSTSIEITHRAVLHVRDLSFGHYLILEKCYEPPGMNNKELLEHIGPRVGAKTIDVIKRMRHDAEQMVANHRMGQSAVLYENSACMD